MNNNLSSNQSLRTTTNAHEPPMQASKWIKCPLLISADEMDRLIKSLDPLHIYITGTLTPQGSGEVSTNEFLQKYREYVTQLSQGQLPDKLITEPFFPQSLQLLLKRFMLFSLKVTNNSSD